MKSSPQTEYIDIHYHAPESLSERKTDDVLRMVNLLVYAGCELPVNQWDTTFSAGIHPKDFEKPDFVQLEKLLASPRCAAIGECGLDRLSSKDLREQIRVFTRQAEMAEFVKKPVIVHCVRAFPELIRLKRGMNPRMPWILHGYRGNERKTMELTEAGFLFSFGRGLLLSAADMQAFFHRIPADRIFCETDESQEDIRRIYAEAALLCRMSEPEFRQTVRGNFERVFTL